MRNPRRTASSASALMVGTAVVALFTTFGASVKASIDTVTDDDFSGDLIVLPDGFSGAELSPDLAPAIGDVPGVAAAGRGVLRPGSHRRRDGRRRGDRRRAAGQRVRRRRGGGLGPTGSVAATSPSATSTPPTTTSTIGSTLPATFVDGDTVDLQVGGDLRPADDVRRRGHRPGRPGAARRPAPGRRVVLVDARRRRRPRRRARRRSAPSPTSPRAPAPLDRAEYKARVGEQVDSMLFVVYGLLGVAVVIAVLAIGNTLALSIHDRTPRARTAPGARAGSPPGARPRCAGNR